MQALYTNIIVYTVFLVLCCLLALISVWKAHKRKLRYVCWIISRGEGYVSAEIIWRRMGREGGGVMSPDFLKRFLPRLRKEGYLTMQRPALIALYQLTDRGQAEALRHRPRPRAVVRSLRG
ncbi:MAG: hypothetical protein HYT39_03455 [Candidatus Sungbacteria bacterium]|nr:hypothetical protein [Candidatus Sungbacteria bacterium]